MKKTIFNKKLGKIYHKSYKISKKIFLSIIGLLILIIVIGLIIVNSKEHVKNDKIIIASFMINILFSIFQLLNSIRKHTFSFDLMFWIFSLFFFGYAPLLQYYSNSYAWNLHPTNNEILIINVYIFIWYIFYSIGKKINLSQKKIIKKTILIKKYISHKNMLNFLLLISILITFYYLIFEGISGIVVRSTSINNELNSMMSLLVTHVFHNWVLFTLVFFILEAKRKGRITYQTVLISICFIISCFPTGLARNMMASFYAGLLIITFDGTKKNYKFTFLIFLGLVLVFPAINIFRNIHTLSGDNLINLIVKSIQNTYLAGDYDAHQMFISTQQYVKIFGYSYGYQLIGALLFFIPRTLWNLKPYGSGKTIFESLSQYWFTNVSCPLVAEGYINFGIVGVIIFALIIGIIVNNIDKKYWNKKNGKLQIIYPFIMFQFFFLLRGDMMSGFAYLIAQYAIGSLIYFLMTLGGKNG